MINVYVSFTSLELEFPYESKNSLLCRFVKEASAKQGDGSCAKGSNDLLDRMILNGMSGGGDQLPLGA